MACQPTLYGGVPNVQSKSARIAPIVREGNLVDAGAFVVLARDETSLGMQTVRTILDREDWTDRTSQRRLEKIDYKPVRAELTTSRARKRTRDALPKMIAETLAAGKELLLKEAKGLK
jgi:hypothetical protein